MASLHKEFAPGLEIVVVPSTQFNQESDSCVAVAKFKQTNGIEFTLLELSDLNGPTTSELYTVLKAETNSKDIGWNFGSYFLVDRDGAIARYDGVSPNGMREQIVEALAAGGVPSL